LTQFLKGIGKYSLSMESLWSAN